MTDGHEPAQGQTSVGSLFLRPAYRGAGRGPGAQRTSALRAPVTAGTVLLHGDLHNHSDLSDGFGAAQDAFVSMRAAGLDAAALTDHAGITDRDGVLDRALQETLRRVSADAGMPSAMMSDSGYQRAGELADLADQADRFAAIRGFEWTTPHIGHVNVWFSPVWTPVTDVEPATGMSVLRDWITDVAGTVAGADVLAGWNHPGREPLRYEGFRYDARLADRLVSLEMFNRDTDYLFEGVSRGARSPLLDCLDAGWWPGLLGVSDEHTPRWGFEPERGRAGLWVRQWSRAGIREALVARRFFATREAGLRLDMVAAWARAGASAPDALDVADRPEAVRMGGRLSRAVAADIPGVDTAAVDLALDIDGGPTWDRREVAVAALTTGASVPEVVAEGAARSGVPTTLRVPVPLDGSVPWLVVRVADPAVPNDRPGPPGHPANRRALAYASPIGVG